MHGMDRYRYAKPPETREGVIQCWLFDNVELAVKVAAIAWFAYEVLIWINGGYDV